MDIISTVQFITVAPEREGQRLDNFLLSQFAGVPKSRIYRAIRTGEVRVNKKRVKPEVKVSSGDILRIPPLVIKETMEPIVNDSVIELLQNSILYEDSNIIALNKPSGIPVHGGTDASFGIIDALRKARPEIKMLELIHRLDKGTSGCLLIAKKRSALTYFHQLLREGEIVKEYLCLVKGKCRPEQRVALPLKKNTLQSGERIVRVDKEGKDAMTDFYLEASYSSASLLRARLHTGRTHQIRVHLQAIAHPVAGDDKYGDKDFNKHMRSYGLRRMFLHAETLKFKCPDSEKEITVFAPLEESLQSCLNQLIAKNTN
jgi:23S rRNA pseudouridine955/2504/2580 synthase